MVDFLATLATLQTKISFDVKEDYVWEPQEDCPNCGSNSLVMVAGLGRPPTQREAHFTTQWLLCRKCEGGSVKTRWAIYPPTRKLTTPDGLPEELETVWEEVRDCLGVNAYHAVAMLCRKILFQMAVDHGMPEKKDNGYAQSFSAAVEYLQNQGVVTLPMRDWVESIREVGNDANHEIAPISGTDAELIAKFTHTLMMSTYDFPSRMQATKAPDPD